MCFTASTTTGTITGEEIHKFCAPSYLCRATGNQTFSASYGTTTLLSSAQCCNTDNCNSANLPFPTIKPVNGLKCFTCDPSTSLCDTPLPCMGEDNNCFEANMTGNSFTYRGCASTSVCQKDSPIKPLNWFLGDVNINCCSTNLCNSAPNTATTATTTTATTATTNAATTAKPTTATTAKPNAATTAKPNAATTVTTATTAILPLQGLLLFILY